jgi:hypothetical protein
MNKLVGLGVVAFTAIIACGCAPMVMTAVPSVQGRAYVVRGGTEVWNCDATSGEPVCYQTKKKYGAPMAK